MKLGSFKFNIELTWSKFVALIVLVLAFILDIQTKSGGTVFMFSIPFIVFLITGKQYLDTKKKSE